MTLAESYTGNTPYYNSGHVDGVYDICQHSKILAMGVGYVVSPNYPNPYSNQLNCSLTLSTTQSRAMELAIIGE